MHSFRRPNAREWAWIAAVILAAAALMIKFVCFSGKPAGNAAVVAKPVEK